MSQIATARFASAQAVSTRATKEVVLGLQFRMGVIVFYSEANVYRCDLK
jgi:hypothetical protein